MVSTDTTVCGRGVTQCYMARMKVLSPYLAFLTPLWLRSWNTSLHLGEGESLGSPLGLFCHCLGQAFFLWSLAGAQWLLSKSFSLASLFLP